MNKKIRCTITVISTVVLLASISTMASAREHGGHNLLVQWKGVALPASLPAGVGGDTVPAGTSCFKLPMVTPGTNIRIGTGFDCIANLGSVPTTGEGTVTTYYIFVFGDEGSIVTQNRAVVRLSADDDPLNPIPVSGASGNGNSTHLVGSTSTENTIADGTRQFRNAEGNVHVTGAPNLASFPAQIVFDHIFVIDLK